LQFRPPWLQNTQSKKYAEAIWLQFKIQVFVFYVISKFPKCCVFFYTWPQSGGNFKFLMIFDRKFKIENMPRNGLRMIRFRSESIKYDQQDMPHPFIILLGPTFGQIFEKNCKNQIFQKKLNKRFKFLIQARFLPRILFNMLPNNWAWEYHEWMGRVLLIMSGPIFAQIGPI